MNEPADPACPAEPCELADPRDPAEAAILALLRARRAGATICPSEAARRLAPDDWRPRMAEVQAAARAMVARGCLEMRQRGLCVDPAEVRGPVRLALPPRT